MHKVALSAIVVLLLVAAANIHQVGADAAHPVMLNTITAKQIVTAKAVKPITKKPNKIVLASLITTKQPAPPAPVLVTVQAGDTLTSIAVANNTTYTRLFAANPAITDPNTISVGLQVRIPDASEQLADRDQPAAVAAPSTTTVARTASYSYSAAPAVTGNDAKAFIYSHESGNNPNSMSASGCYGLGQDCNGRVQAQCGADYACQDAYFTNYAVSRYGGWEGAAAFWQANGWW